MKLIAKLLDVLVPRFLQEDVAPIDVGTHYEIVCAISDLQPGEEYDAVATMQTFNFFGLALFPKMVGGVRPFQSSEAGGGK